LVREHADVVMRAGEVGENERHADRRERRTESTAGLAWPVPQIEESPALHLPKKLTQPLIQSIEHRSSLGYQKVVPSGGFRIAGRIDQRLIPESQPVPAKRGAPLFQQARDQRHHMSNDL